MNEVLQNKLQEMSKLLKIAFVSGYKIGYKEGKEGKPERKEDTLVCSCEKEPSPSCEIHGMFLCRGTNK